MDERAFYSLYEQTSRSLRAYVAKSLGNIALADDIVQAVYLRLLRLPSAPRAEAAKPYLFRMATNLMIDHWRRRQREMKAMNVAEEEPETVSRDPSIRLDLGRVFVRLKPRERQLMWLAYVECATHREIGETLGLSAKSIRVLLFRAREKLARLLRESGWNASHE